MSITSKSEALKNAESLLKQQKNRLIEDIEAEMLQYTGQDVIIPIKEFDKGIVAIIAESYQIAGWTVSEEQISDVKQLRLK